MASTSHSSQMEDWKKKRTRAAEELRSLADEIQTHHKNVNISKLVGTCASLVGTGIAVGGAIASVFTFGATAPLIAIGGVIAASGALTTGGAELAEALLTNQRRKNVQKMMDDDCKGTAAVMDLVGTLLKDKISHIEKDMAAPAGKAAKSVYEIVRAFKTAEKAAQISAAGADVAVTTMKSFFKSLSKAGKVSLGLSLVSVPLDIYTLVKTSVDVHKGSIPDIANSIREYANGMEADLQMIEELAFCDKQ